MNESGEDFSSILRTDLGQVYQVRYHHRRRCNPADRQGNLACSHHPSAPTQSRLLGCHVLLLSGQRTAFCFVATCRVHSSAVFTAHGDFWGHDPSQVQLSFVGDHARAAPHRCKRQMTQSENICLQGATSLFVSSVWPRCHLMHG
jgi:hypothetical protein